MNLYVIRADYGKEDPGFARIGLVNANQLVDLMAEHRFDIPEELKNKLNLKVGLVLV